MPEVNPPPPYEPKQESSGDELDPASAPHGYERHSSDLDSPVSPLSTDSEQSEDDDERSVHETPVALPDGTSDSATQVQDDRKKSKKQPSFRLSLDPSSSSSRSKGRVSTKDGRLKITVNERANRGLLAKALQTSIRNHLQAPTQLEKHATGSKALPQPDDAALEPIPKLNIVVMVIGSRGDIQPFIKIAKILKEKHGHRVRIATHPVFHKFVKEDCGLEFFSVGGDPAKLMAFMVKNPGLIPSYESVRQGEIGERRATMFEMFQGFWKACMTDDHEDPFIADAIIANPPSFAHVHCAERLGCPLHIMFTFPYTPTTKFPHPLANIKSSNVDESYTNFMSYPFVEMMTWQGLGDLVNKFRVETLGLEAVSRIWAPNQLYRMRVPYTYMWSPGLVSKPHDWGNEIDISGFVFLDLAQSYTPTDELASFLKAGEPPVYIGFGSIVVDDPARFTTMIFDAVKKAGVRAVVNEGWGGLGDKGQTPDNIFMLGNVPHDWLFPRCRAVVHHGGAGTTAIGLKCAKPTMIVPFFGDQPFWGAMVSSAQAGATKCIPYKHLDSDKLADGIKECLTSSARANVQKIATSIVDEGDGAANAVRSFHANLPLRGQRPMRCSLLQERACVWSLKKKKKGVGKMRLSALAAKVLVNEGLIKYNNLDLYRQYEWSDFQAAFTPSAGTLSTLAQPITGLGVGVAEGTGAVGKDVKARARYERAKRTHWRREKERKKEAARTGHSAPDGISIYPDQEFANVDPTNDRVSNRPASSHARESTNDTAFTITDSTFSSPVTTSTAFNPATNEPPPHHFAQSIVHGASIPASAVAKLPIDLTMAFATGFHNLPLIYGDDTVRPLPRVDGVKEGMKAGGNEFVYGMWDALTGVFAQPWKGAKQGWTEGRLTDEDKQNTHGPSMSSAQESTSGTPRRHSFSSSQTQMSTSARLRNTTTGLAKGLGKGVAGFIYKPIAAGTAPIAYTLKGLEKEIIKSTTPVGTMKRCREQQGNMEWKALVDGGGAASSSLISDDAGESRVPEEQDDCGEGKMPSRPQQTRKEVLRGWAVMEDLWEKDHSRKRDDQRDPGVGFRRRNSVGSLASTTKTSNTLHAPMTPSTSRNSGMAPASEVSLPLPVYDQPSGDTR
ncbi:MAG: hypothetical protein M1831_000782 [Alyxoria varia]|nr:MAG: hypothetical protein M1831_000782 [Alyxoria varia]